MLFDSPYSQFFNNILAWANQLPEPKRSTALQTISAHPIGSALLRARGQASGPSSPISPLPPTAAAPSPLLSGYRQLQQQGLSPENAALAAWRLWQRRWDESPEGQATRQKIAEEMAAMKKQSDEDMARARYLIEQRRPLPARWDRFTRANVDQDAQIHAEVQRELAPLDAKLRQWDQWARYGVQPDFRGLPRGFLPPPPLTRPLSEELKWKADVAEVNRRAAPLLAELESRKNYGTPSQTTISARRTLPAETPQQAAARQRMEAAEKVRRQAWQNIASARAENRRMRLGEPTNPILQAIVNYGPEAAQLMYQKEFVDAQRQHELQMADKQGQWQVKANEAAVEAKRLTPEGKFFQYRQNLLQQNPKLTFKEQLAAYERDFPEDAKEWKERYMAAHPELFPPAPPTVPTPSSIAPVPSPPTARPQNGLPLKSAPQAGPPASSRSPVTHPPLGAEQARERERDALNEKVAFWHPEEQIGDKSSATQVTDALRNLVTSAPGIRYSDQHMQVVRQRLKDAGISRETLETVRKNLGPGLTTMFEGRDAYLNRQQLLGFVEQILRGY